MDLVAIEKLGLLCFLPRHILDLALVLDSPPGIRITDPLSLVLALLILVRIHLGDIMDAVHNLGRLELNPALQ